MSKGIPALTYLPKTQITVASGSTFAIRSLKAGLNKVAQFQEEETGAGTFANEKCLMDNPYSTCIWDFILTGGSTFATGTATLATVTAGDTLVVNGLTYTAVTGVKANNTEFSVDGTDTVDAADLADSISQDARTGTIGDVSAVSAAAVVTMTSDLEGTAGNAVTLTETGTTITVSGATFTGGANAADFQLTFDSEDVDNITTIGRPALSNRRVLDISIAVGAFEFTVRSAQAALNLIDKFEDAVASTGVGTTGDITTTDLIARGPTPYEAYTWNVNKADNVYILVPTVNS